MTEPMIEVKGITKSFRTRTETTCNSNVLATCSSRWGRSQARPPAVSDGTLGRIALVRGGRYLHIELLIRAGIVKTRR